MSNQDWAVMGVGILMALVVLVGLALMMTPVYWEEVQKRSAPYRTADDRMRAELALRAGLRKLSHQHEPTRARRTVWVCRRCGEIFPAGWPSSYAATAPLADDQSMSSTLSMTSSPVSTAGENGSEETAT